MYASQRLSARVKARNRSHAEANALYAKLIPIFTPLVGQKILKTDYSLLAKINALLPAMSHTPTLNVYRLPRDNSFDWTVKTSEMDSDRTCTYAETTVNIGTLKGDVLDSISPPPNFRTDFTETEVEADREAYWAAKKIADAARDKLDLFGEYDR